jgi:carbon-monoxide dehydrogenase small subunit
MIDGRPMRSCITYAVQTHGRNVSTIEGFDDDVTMEALRNEFTRQHALQCGFCTPGMLITAHDIVTRLANPGEERVREELAGNLCRCTGYAGIVRAVQNVGETMAQGARRTDDKLATPQNDSRPDDRPVIEQTLSPRSAAVVQPDRSLKPADPAPPTPASAGGTVITQSFAVDADIARVWTLFQDIPAVARCIPGVTLSSYDDKTWKGSVEVKMGPISARMGGAGTYNLDDRQKNGALCGSGIDTLSGSRISGSLEFAVASASPRMTQIDVKLTFVLQGLLAQFSRSSIAKEFIGLIVKDFAANVTATLSPGSGPNSKIRTQQTGLNILTLLRLYLMSVLKKLSRGEGP